jgi:hypothetical protein
VTDLLDRDHGRQEIPTRAARIGGERPGGNVSRVRFPPTPLLLTGAALRRTRGERFRLGIVDDLEQDLGELFDIPIRATGVSVGQMG